MTDLYYFAALASGATFAACLLSLMLETYKDE